MEKPNITIENFDKRVIYVRFKGSYTAFRKKSRFAIGHFEISAMEYEAAWQYMYQEWLFKGEEKPRDSFPFELYVTEPPKQLKGKSFTDIYIPIE